LPKNIEWRQGGGRGKKPRATYLREEKNGGGLPLSIARGVKFDKGNSISGEKKKNSLTVTTIIREEEEEDLDLLLSPERLP